jgi:polar amino acid transport system substrate-binding protein
MRTFFFSLLAAATLAVPVSAQTIERIKETNQFNIGFRTDAAPLSFAEPNGQPAGYSPLICVGIAHAVSKALDLPDLKVSFRAVGTEDRFEKVASGEIDLLCGAATITQRRLEIVDFSVPTYVDGTAVLMRNDIGDALNDLSGKKVGVRSGTTTQESLLATLTSEGLDAEVVLFDSHVAAIEAIKNKEIDAYFADQSILMYTYLSQNLSEEFKIPDRLLTLEKQGLALTRGDSAFRLLIDSALTDMFSNGTMEKLFGEAFPGATPGKAMQALYLMSPTRP